MFVVTLEVVVVLDVVPFVDGATILMRLYAGGSYDPPIELKIISYLDYISSSVFYFKKLSR